MVLASLAFGVNVAAAIFCSLVGIKNKNAMYISLVGLNAALAVVNLIRIITMAGSSVG